MNVTEGWLIPEPSPKGHKRKPRLVLRVEADKVYYGTGSNEKTFCLLKTFQRWVKTYNAQPADKTALASYELR